MGVAIEIWFALLLGLSVAGGIQLLRWGVNWGSSPDERARAMPRDEYLEGEPRVRVAMARAISINAAPFVFLAETGPHQFDGRVEFPGTVYGVIGEQVVFRGRRIIPDRELPYAYTGTLEIAGPVATFPNSWSALKARF